MNSYPPAAGHSAEVISNFDHNTTHPVAPPSTMEVDREAAPPQAERPDNPPASASRPPWYRRRAQPKARYRAIQFEIDSIERRLVVAYQVLKATRGGPATEAAQRYVDKLEDRRMAWYRELYRGDSPGGRSPG